MRPSATLPLAALRFAIVTGTSLLAAAAVSQRVSREPVGRVANPAASTLPSSTSSPVQASTASSTRAIPATRYFQSPHYNLEIETDDPATVKRIAFDIERLYGKMATFLHAKPTTRMTVQIYSDRERFVAALEQAGENGILLRFRRLAMTLDGCFVRSSGELKMYLGGDGDFTRRNLAHEGFHQFLFFSSDPKHGLTHWLPFEEGLCEVFSYRNSSLQFTYPGVPYWQSESKAIQVAYDLFDETYARSFYFAMRDVDGWPTTLASDRDAPKRDDRPELYNNVAAIVAFLLDEDRAASQGLTNMLQHGLAAAEAWSIAFRQFTNVNDLAPRFGEYLRHHLLFARASWGQWYVAGKALSAKTTMNGDWAQATAQDGARELTVRCRWAHSADDLKSERPWFGLTCNLVKNYGDAFTVTSSGDVHLLRLKGKVEFVQNIPAVTDATARETVVALKEVNDEWLFFVNGKQCGSFAASPGTKIGLLAGLGDGYVTFEPVNDGPYVVPFPATRPSDAGRVQWLVDHTPDWCGFVIPPGDGPAVPTPWPIYAGLASGDLKSLYTFLWLARENRGGSDVVINGPNEQQARAVFRLKPYLPKDIVTFASGGPQPRVQVLLGKEPFRGLPEPLPAFAATPDEDAFAALLTPTPSTQAATPKMAPTSRAGDR